MNQSIRTVAVAAVLAVAAFSAPVSAAVFTPGTDVVLAGGGYGSSIANYFTQKNPAGIRQLPSQEIPEYAPLPNAVVPEPAAWALLIAGFGIVGVAMRRRAVAVAA